jgi:hypothetical protein
VIILKISGIVSGAIIMNENGRNLYHRPEYPWNPKTPLEILKSLYDCYLDGQDSIYCQLVERYWKIVSYQKIRRYNDLQEKGKKQAETMWTNFLAPSHNHFMETIPKQPNHFLIIKL